MQQQLAESAVLHLAHNCPCHVSLFRPVQGQPRSGILAALASEEKGSEDLNLTVLDIAYGLAQAKHYAIHVLHSTTGDHANLPRECTVIEHRSNGQPTLEESWPKNAPAAERRSETCSVTSAMHFYYLHGDASRNICRLAYAQRVNLVVIGAASGLDRKRHALDDAEAVLRQADCSILIVKPYRCVSPVQV
jgi:nucleotide-binding universal stress UspA family protein